VAMLLFTLYGNKGTPGPDEGTAIRTPHKSHIKQSNWKIMHLSSFTASSSHRRPEVCF